MNLAPTTTHDQRLRIYLNVGCLEDLPPTSTWPRLQGTEMLAFLREQGFDGLQNGDPARCREAGLACAGGGRVDRPADALPLARRLRDAGYDRATLHVGTSFEDDAEMDALARAIVEASAETAFPLYLETHRATMTQDIWRTLRLLERVPEVRINGDFSHYYTGHEFPYGDVAWKLRTMQPIFDRVRFIHGRIGNSSNMQVDVGDGEGDTPQQFGLWRFVETFREFWTRSMAGFQHHAGAGESFVFCPEILAPKIYYARMFPGPDGRLREESDRWAQSLVYVKLARQCWAAACAARDQAGVGG